MPKVVEKRKRVVLTLKQKVDICRRLERGESRQQLMVEYGVSIFLYSNAYSAFRHYRAWMFSLSGGLDGRPPPVLAQAGFLQ